LFPDQSPNPCILIFYSCGVSSFSPSGESVTDLDRLQASEVSVSFFFFVRLRPVRHFLPLRGILLHGRPLFNPEKGVWTGLDFSRE